MTDWEPDRYERFAAERRQPFDDLVALCTPVPDGLVYDLGCGTGSRTVDLVDALDARLVVGIDTSDTMLARAPDASSRLRFVNDDFATFTSPEPIDVLVSNAALHWRPDHAAVLAHWRSWLAPGGQMAVQIPVNFDHPTQQMVIAVADEHAEWFGPEGPPQLISTNSESPERYAEILHDLGAVNPRVATCVYPHVLDSTLDVIDWLRGTTLRPYAAALDDETFARFLDELAARLLERYGHQEPFLYTFNRILFHADFPGH